MADHKLSPLAEALLGRSEPAKMRAVWEKGHKVFGRDPDFWRQDDYGFWISFAEYGNRDSPFGWETDHIVPSILGGGDNLVNLRPLHCKKNASLGGLLGGLMG